MLIGDYSTVVGVGRVGGVGGIGGSMFAYVG